MRAAKENDATTAEQYSRESVRIARTTRELLKKFAGAYHQRLGLEGLRPVSDHFWMCFWGAPKVTGWWFQIFCNFHPYLVKRSNLTNIFQIG